jgi:hypothetical protein
LGEFLYFFRGFLFLVCAFLILSVYKIENALKIQKDPKNTKESSYLTKLLLKHNLGSYLYFFKGKNREAIFVLFEGDFCLVLGQFLI